MMDDNAIRAQSLLSNFIRMTVAFSVNHGCIVSVLSLSKTLLGDAGSYQAGTLYITYALFALICAPLLLTFMSSRTGIISASAMYCVYVLSFPAALLTPASMNNLRLFVALFGGIVGGCAAGFLWAAQGTYFVLNAKQYAAAKGIPISDANTQFASLFAGIFLGVELLCKLLPLCFNSIKDNKVQVVSNQVSILDLATCSLFSVLSVLAVFALLTIQNLRDEEDQEDQGKQPKTGLLGSRATAAVRLWFNKPVVLLLAPIQIAFGVCAAMLGYEVTGTMLKAAFGNDATIIGSLMGALVSFTAGSLQFPFKLTADKLGKGPLMILGLSAFVALSILVFFSPSKPGWGTFVPAYLLQGIGRACYEGTNKALYADYFPDDAPAAFSNVVLANGVASAVAYFTFPSLQKSGADGKDAMALIAFVCSLIAICGYLAAQCVRRDCESEPLLDEAERASS